MKIKFIIYNDEASYSETYTEEELNEYVSDPNQYRELSPFPEKDLNKYNGDHQVFGWLESLEQSDVYLPLIDHDVMIEVVHIWE